MSKSIKCKKMLLMCLCILFIPFVWAQQNTRGVVKDIQGESIPGVNIIEKGTVNGTVTDVNGNFSLQLNNANASLLVSFIGFVSQEIVSQSYMDIVLQEDSQNLEEVIVVGYGSQKKVNLAGAVESVGSKTLSSRATRNAAVALQGLVPNLNITPGSGQADNTPSFNIRGTTSINGGSPLILVDGIPTSATDFSRMNSLDIDNISILKDASSAAIYGARAAYGVILVTTKKGNGKVTVQFNNSFGVKNVTRISKPVLDPSIQSYYRKVMGAPWYDLYTDEEVEYARNRRDDPSLSGTIINSRNPTLYTYLENTDWYNEIYDNFASEETHSISISGGSEKVTYYLGIEYFKERGLIQHNKDVMDRFNVRNRIEFRPIEWLTIGNNTALNYAIYNRPTYYSSSYFGESNSNLNPLMPIRNPDGSYTSEGAKYIGSLLEGGNSTTKTPVISSQFTVDFEIVKNVLNIKTDFTAKLTNAKLRESLSDKSIPYKDGPDGVDKYLGWSNYARSWSENTEYTIFNLYMDARKDFGKHNLSAVGGFSQESERYEYLYGQRRDMITDSYPTMQLATGEMTINENITSWAIRSAFYRLTYIFDNKYIIETNGRYDGTSRFPKKDRFGFFPSVSAAWVISQERFFKPFTTWISHAKFRGSYGALGNQALTNAYPYISTLSTGTVNVMLDGSRPLGVNPPGLVSDVLTWEKVNTLNGGIDINFFRNRLAITADIYQRQTIGMLTKGKTLPNVLGTSEPQINAADLKTNGWDLTVAWRDQFQLAGKPFDYGLRFVLSNYRAYITNFDNPTKNLDDYYVGQRIGEIWGFETLGFFKDQADIDNHADQSIVTQYLTTRPIEPGDIKFKDQNGDGVINRGDWTADNPGDAIIIGNNTIQFPYGLDMNAGWNGFDLRIFLQGVGKRDYWLSDVKFFGTFYSPWVCVWEENLNHWTPENTNAYYPRMKSYVGYTGNPWQELSAPQTRYLQNAAYLRFKNVTFGYTLPKSLVSSIKMETVRFYFSGENLLEFTKLHKNYDPEALNANTHPFYRTYSIGLNITF